MQDLVIPGAFVAFALGWLAGVLTIMIPAAIAASRKGKPKTWSSK